MWLFRLRQEAIRSLKIKLFTFEISEEMIPEQIENSEMDDLIRNVLASDENLIIPSGLSEKIIKKLGKRALLRELVLELFLKIGLVIGSLAILAGVFFLINKTSVLSNVYNQIINNWQIIVPLLLLVFFSLLIDQVGLRFYNVFSRESGMET